MIVRELPDGTAYILTQEAHADVAAQCAAHWGNDRFDRIDPFNSVVFGVLYHDSGHREMEADLPIDGEKGLPYPFRGAPPELRRREADEVNARWVGTRDPYASLVVATHHAGLRKRRYDTVRARQPSAGGPRPAAEERLGRESAFADFQDWQRETARALGLAEPAARAAFWHNYSLLQVFDLLSLHLCCDGYRGDQIQELTLEGVPVRYGSDERVDLHLTPTGPSSLRVAPYPFDCSPLPIAVIARRMEPCAGGADEVAKAAYHRAVREPLYWQFTC